MKKLLIITLSLFLVNCTSNELTNAEAETLIKELGPNYCYTRNIRTQYNTFSGKTDENEKPLVNVIKRLKKDGLLNITSKQHALGIKTFKIHLTQNAIDLGYGKRDNNFPIAQTDFLEILGISQNKNEATVRIKSERKETPFYDLHRLKYQNSRNLECKPRIYESDITFVKFDNGWKIK